MEQHDRLLAVHHAPGGMETLDFAAAILRSRKFVQRWAYAYRDGGIDAIVLKPRGGRASALGGEAAAKLTTRLDAGAKAWQRLTQGVLKSVCACDYTSREIRR